MFDDRWKTERAEFERLARAHRAGKLSGNDFLKATDPRWRAMAARLYARWRRKLPSWVEQSDVLAELQMLALEHVKLCNPKRGDFGPYVVWCVYRRGQRAIHKWRGAKLSGNEGRNPSRAERSFSTFAVEAWQENLRAPERDAVRAMHAEERFALVLSNCRSTREALVLLALRECDGSVRHAAEAIWKDYAARVQLEVRTEKAAERVVRRVLSKTAKRINLTALESAAA
jgi:hypothetical protein